MTLRVGVLVSGAGTNLQALLDACAEPGFPAQIVLVGCNRGGASALGRAAAARVPVCLADRVAIPGRARRQGVLLQALTAERVDLIVLAGFDEMLVPEFVAAYGGARPVS